MVLDISKLTYGGAFVLGGAGVGYASGKFLPENWKPAGYVAGLGLGVYGLYSVYQAFRKEEGEPAVSTDRFPIVITDPTPGEGWGVLTWHSVNVQVSNPYSVSKKVFVGMSFIHDETGQVYDYDVKEIVISKNSIEELSWILFGTPKRGPVGLYWVISAVWDKLPTIGGDAIRLGEAESSVIYVWWK